MRRLFLFKAGIEPEWTLSLQGFKSSCLFYVAYYQCFQAVLTSENDKKRMRFRVRLYWIKDREILVLLLIGLTTS